MPTTLDPISTKYELQILFQQLSRADCKLVQACLQSIADERDGALAKVVELEAELRQLRTARDRLAADDGLTTMEVKLVGGSMVVGHGVIVTPDQRGGGGD